MHLRDGKVLGARSGDSRTMAEPKKATERRPPDINVESDSRSHHTHHNPTLPAVHHENILAPLRVDPRDELILQMDRDLHLLKGTVDQLTGLKDMVDQLTRLSQPQLHPYAPQQTLRHEDGKTMSSFLANYEIECLEGNVPPVMWATRMRRYLTGDALDYYVHMRRVGADLQQWEPIRYRFLQRFCRDTRDRVLARLARNSWRGDHGLYAIGFAQAVARRVTIPPMSWWGTSWPMYRWIYSALLRRTAQSVTGTGKRQQQPCPRPKNHGASCGPSADASNKAYRTQGPGRTLR